MFAKGESKTTIYCVEYHFAEGSTLQKLSGKLRLFINTEKRFITDGEELRNIFSTNTLSRIRILEDVEITIKTDASP